MSEEPRGYIPEEIERGEDQAWHIPIWGCLAFTGVAITAAVGIYALTF